MVEVVSHVVREFVRECERAGGVDEFAQDQLVVFQALAGGPTHVDAGRRRGGKEAEEHWASLHTRTVRWVCEEMLGSVFDDAGGCHGRPTTWEIAEGLDGISCGVGKLQTDESEDDD